MQGELWSVAAVACSGETRPFQRPVDRIYVRERKGSVTLSVVLAPTFGKMKSLSAVGRAGRSRWLRWTC